MMRVDVNGPRDANRLYVFTGTAVFNWHRTDDDDWAREPMTISLIGVPGIPRIFEENVVDHVESAALAAVYFRETGRRDAVGWAVDAVEAFFTRGPADFADFGLRVQLALRGNDARLLRLSFRLDVLANM
ncbi:MAG: hypothetical protein AAGC60_07400 [Acidobacteriota bacterium]